MKQRTKEELIEYFIEQLGDNEVLGQFMSIDQIREKLNNIIKEVTYAEDLKYFYSSWDTTKNGTGIVNFDSNKIPEEEERIVIVHELLHALSTTSISVKNHPSRRNEKIGVCFKKTSFRKVKKVKNAVNIALNEGIIHSLTEQITGIDTSSYIEEKFLYKFLTVIINSNDIIKTTFLDEEAINCEPLDIFKETLFSKYDPKLGYDSNLGIELNDNIKKLLFLSDSNLSFKNKNSLYGLNKIAENIHKKIKKEINNTMLEMLTQVINNTKDLKELLGICTLIKGTPLEEPLIDLLHDKNSKDFPKINNQSYIPPII